MRQARFLAPGAVEGERAGIYHCVSRVVDRRRVLGKEERESFVRMMRLYEEFCGVRVLTYCVMSNHFHILLEVPQRPEEGLSEKEFFRRLRLLYSELYVEEVAKLIRQRKRMKDEDGVEAIKERYLYRMWNLSQFMKVLKQRFTQWFNKRQGRKGTLWEDRFKSVIVEDGYAARVMAAYIDLNPVRAGMVAKPEQYRWCGYAEALAGKRAARVGIERMMSEFVEWGMGRKVSLSWRKVIGEYRVILFTDGAERMAANARTQEVRVARKGVSPAATEEVQRKEGEMTRTEMLRHRVRYFVDGTAIGSKEFLEDVFERSRERFGPARTSGARKLRGFATRLHSLRDLQGGIG